MPFKINIAEKSGKTWKLQSESETIIGKAVGDNIEGKDVSPTLEGYEFKISGASDLSGFPHRKETEGTALRKVLLTKGWGMQDKRSGVRLKKTVRGKQLSEKTSQINLTIVKQGHKHLHEIFPDQNKAPEVKAEAPAQ